MRYFFILIIYIIIPFWNSITKGDIMKLWPWIFQQLRTNTARTIIVIIAMVIIIFFTVGLALFILIPLSQKKAALSTRFVKLPQPKTVKELYKVVKKLMRDSQDGFIKDYCEQATYTRQEWMFLNYVIGKKVIDMNENIGKTFSEKTTNILIIIYKIISIIHDAKDVFIDDVDALERYVKQTQADVGEGRVRQLEYVETDIIKLSKHNYGHQIYIAVVVNRLIELLMTLILTVKHSEITYLGFVNTKRLLYEYSLGTTADKVQYGNILRISNVYIDACEVIMKKMIKMPEISLINNLPIKISKYLEKVRMNDRWAKFPHIRHSTNKFIGNHNEIFKNFEVNDTSRPFIMKMIKKIINGLQYNKITKLIGGMDPVVLGPIGKSDIKPIPKHAATTAIGKLVKDIPVEKLVREPVSSKT